MIEYYKIESIISYMYRTNVYIYIYIASVLYFVFKDFVKQYKHALEFT